MDKLNRLPWPHLLLDDFLPDEVLAKSLGEIESDTYEFGIESRGTGRIEYSLLRSKTLWRAIYSPRIVSLLSSAFGVAVSLNKHNMLQLRRMNEQTPEFPCHNDFTSTGEVIASFLYISRDWSKGCGGRLHLYKSKEQRNPSKSIEPIQNRFVAFGTKSTHWHSVERVHGWERLSVLAMWDIDAVTTT
jgi:hypothetical protein